MKKHLFNWIAGLTLAVSAGLSQAAPILDVDSNGILTGARNVDVNGVLYDVEFRDGTCISLYDGCDAPSDFPFSTQAEAQAASISMFAFVLIGIFDTETQRTNGCNSLSSSACNIVIPFALAPPDRVRVYQPINDATIPDLIGPIVQAIFITGDTTATDILGNNVTWAVWRRAEVPAPSTGLCVMLGAALAGTISRLRRRERFLQDRT